MRVLLIVGLAVVSATSGAEVPIYSGEPSGEFMKEWLVCGPFPLLAPGETDTDTVRLPGMYTDYLAAQGGEANPRVDEGQSVTHGDTTCTWKPYRSPEDTVDLDAALGNANTAVGYAYCEIEAAKPTVAVLALGSNDGARAWLNGEAILDNPASRGFKADHDVVPVALKEGRNKLLIKVEERGNRWQLGCRLLPLERATLTERFPLFEVASQNGSPVLRARPADSVMKTLVTGARLSVSAEEPRQERWNGEWSGAREMPLPVESEHFARYHLTVTAHLADGEDLTMEIPFSVGEPAEQTLFESGRTDYVIVVAENGSESEKWAANELRTWLKEVSGADFAVQDSAAGVPERALCIGRDARIDERLNRLAGEDLPVPAAGDESFRYVNVGPTLFIYGGRDRGTMYGVMSFLEREMGVRFYTPTVTVAPKKERYAFTYLNHGEKPGIRVRNDFYYEAFEPIWAARNRINGAMSHREQPGGLEAYWAVHTFFPLMPPDEFFGEHPEYYSLIDGKRQWERAQLCLTNPDVLRIITERIRQKMRELPQYLIYDVSQNDWANPCQCDNCQAIAKREESEAGPVIWFVNQVAEAVEEEFPDKFIGTLAYQYTRKPPKTIKPRENVVVRFCSIECCFAHPFTECPENESFVEDMEGWAAKAPHIYIWDYVVNFSHYIMPYPNFRVLQPNMQFFRDHNAIGIMEQAAYQSRGGEFAELRAYVISKLLWDPECNVPEVINDFMYGYYGRAGQYVRAYFDLLHNRLTPDTHIHLGLQPDDKLFSDAFVRDAEALFDKAETVADNEEIRRRVEMARLPVMYLKCRRSPVEARQDGTYARFREIVEREGITHYAESGEPHKAGFHQFVESAE